MFYLALRALDTVEDDMDLERFAPYVISTTVTTFRANPSHHLTCSP